MPVYTNIFAPPLPQPKRFVELGRTLRQLVEAWPSDKRVAIIGTGHLSLELGGPRQFGPHGPDPEFDAKAVDWIANGDLEGCLSEVTLDSLHAPGNATHGFMDFMLMMGVAGENAKADYVDTYDLFHTMEAYFTWYPNGVRERSQREREMSKYLLTSSSTPSTATRSWSSGTGTTRAARSTWWEAERANRLLNCPAARRAPGWRSPTPSARHCPHTTTRRCSRWARTRSSR